MTKNIAPPCNGHRTIDAEPFFPFHPGYMTNVLKWLGIGFAVFVAVVLLLPFGTVGAGERGVRLRWGAVTGDVLGEGLYLRVPIMDRVEVMDVKIQKEQVEATAASRDLQSVATVVAANFRLKPDQAARVYQEVGVDYKERLVDPALQEAVKASTAKYTAEELITKREEVRESIKSHLKEKLESRGIDVDDFNIVNFEFSESFNVAIENKVTAEQSALAAKNKLEQIKFEADQRIAAARGTAEAIRIEADALKSNPQVLQLRAIEKWDGRLPAVSGGATPFVNVSSITGQ
jgi:regulator of protease activity HflC (stomatin/prohibitin superfamily)